MIGSVDEQEEWVLHAHGDPKMTREKDEELVVPEGVTIVLFCADRVLTGRVDHYVSYLDWMSQPATHTKEDALQAFTNMLLGTKDKGLHPAGWCVLNSGSRMPNLALAARDADREMGLYHRPTMFALQDQKEKTRKVLLVTYGAPQLTRFLVQGTAAGDEIIKVIKSDLHEDDRLKALHNFVDPNDPDNERYKILPLQRDRMGLISSNFFVPFRKLENRGTDGYRRTTLKALLEQLPVRPTAKTSVLFYLFVCQGNWVMDSKWKKNWTTLSQAAKTFHNKGKKRRLTTDGDILSS